MKAVTWISLILFLILCGCGIEPEDREFVTAVGFDKGYKVYVLTAEGNSGEDTNEKNKFVSEGNGESIAAALEDVSAKCPGELFFGHTSLCIVDISSFSDKTIVNEIVDFMEKDTGVSRRVIIMASDDPAAVMEGKKAEKDVAEFIGEYYRSHKDVKPVELDKLCIALREGGNILIPLINAENDSFDIEGGVLMSEGIAVRKLSKEEMRQVSWLNDDGGTGNINIQTKNGPCFVRFSKKDIDVEPERIIIRLSTEDGIENLSEEVLDICSEKIEKEALSGIKILADEGCDLIKMKRSFEKNGIILTGKADLSNVDVDVCLNM